MLYIEDSNPLLYLRYMLWITWYMCASVLKLYSSSSLLESIFVSCTYPSLKFLPILKGPTSAFFPRNGPRSLKWNEASPLLHYHRIWFHYPIPLVSSCFRRKLPYLEIAFFFFLTRWYLKRQWTRWSYITLRRLNLLLWVTQGPSVPWFSFKTFLRCCDLINNHLIP